MRQHFVDEAKIDIKLLVNLDKTIDKRIQICIKKSQELFSLSAPQFSRKIYWVGVYIVLIFRNYLWILVGKRLTFTSPLPGKCDSFDRIYGFFDFFLLLLSLNFILFLFWSIPINFTSDHDKELILLERKFDIIVNFGHYHDLLSVYHLPGSGYKVKQTSNFEAIKICRLHSITDIGLLRQDNISHLLFRFIETRFCSAFLVMNCYHLIFGLL